jgi:hypothetical protein
MYYYVGSPNCPTGAISENSTWCFAGESPTNPEAGRVLNAETVRAVMFNWWNYSRDPAMASAIDTMVNAEWAKPGTCPAGSTVCVPDGYWMQDYDPGGVWVSGTPPTAANPKWFGMPFGLNPQPSWPAMRLGGAQPVRNVHRLVGYDINGVKGAGTVNVVAVAPNGIVGETACTASPCTITVDARLGGYLLKLEYFSPSHKLLAVTEMAVNSSQ